MENAFNELINEIKVEKNQYNSFGKYRFRSNEDIQTALKPLLLKYNFSLRSETSIQEVAGNVWLGIKYEVIDLSSENKEVVGKSSAYVAVDLNKKGADSSQLSGAALSYLQKYGLSQLLMLDDTKDPDSTNTHGQDNKPAANKASAKIAMSKLKEQVNAGKATPAQAKALVKSGKVDMNK